MALRQSCFSAFSRASASHTRQLLAEGAKGRISCGRLFFLTPQTPDRPEQQQKQSTGHQSIHNKLEHIESACPANMKMTEHPAQPFVQLRKQRLSHARSVDFSEL